MLFAHLKRILKLDRLRLRGPNGARDEFHLAAATLRTGDRAGNDAADLKKAAAGRRAVPMRKKCGSEPFAARHAVAMHRVAVKSKLAAMPRQSYLRIRIIVSRGETAVGDGTMPLRRLQPAL
jgi:hypothetical protein